MKRQLTTLFAACGLAGLLGTTAAFAQSYKLASEIPFAFHVGEQTCASGPYTLTKTDAGTPPSIRGSKGSCALFLSFGTPLGGKSQPKLVFHRYQDQYFLSEIWTDNGTGARLPISQREQEVREQRPAAERASTTLYLLSRR